MKFLLKKQNLLFSLDQIIDSAMVFCFIALGASILGKTEMANVVLTQSSALVGVLLCSCFTTQYLLIRFEFQGITFWGRFFGFFFLLILAGLGVLFGSLEIIAVFSAGILSEYIKRYCYYTENTIASLTATAVTFLLFISFVIAAKFGWFSANSSIYIFFYSAIRIATFAVLFLSLKRNESNQTELRKSIDLRLSIKDSFKTGFIFSVITMIFWIYNQGFFVLLKSEIPPSEITQIRVSQNVFGIVTMIVALFDSFFLKENVKGGGSNFNIKNYFKFVMLGLIIVLLNYGLLIIFSFTIYQQLDVLKYSFYLALAQFFYILTRIPVLILKIRYNLNIILFIYVISLLVSSFYLVTEIGSDNFTYIVKAIALANFITLMISLIVVFIKEPNSVQAN